MRKHTEFASHATLRHGSQWCRQSKWTHPGRCCCFSCSILLTVLLIMQLDTLCVFTTRKCWNIAYKAHRFFKKVSMTATEQYIATYTTAARYSFGKWWEAWHIDIKEQQRTSTHITRRLCAVPHHYRLEGHCTDYCCQFMVRYPPQQREMYTSQCN